MFHWIKKKNRNNVDLIKSVLKSLPKEYEVFLDQIENGLIKKISEDSTFIKNYYGVSYNNKVFNKYMDSKERYFKISKIKVFDDLNGVFVPISLYFYCGVIMGYSIDSELSEFKLNHTKIDITQIKKENNDYNDYNDYNKIANLLTTQEVLNVNKDDVYVVELNNNTYYHIKDLEDGDFIAIDLTNNLYEIHHDPLTISKIDRSLLINMIS